MIRIIDALDRLDFVLSIENPNVADFLQFFVTYWWIFAGIGVAWYAWNRRYGRNRQPSFAVTVVLVALMSSLLGATVTAKFSNAPDLLPGYGVVPVSSGSACRAVVEAQRLRQFSEDYELILVCGANDPGVDVMRDDRIAISTPRTIITSERRQTVQFRLTRSHAKLLNAYQSTWFQLAVVPRGIDQSRYDTLADIKSDGVGGILVGHRPGANTYIGIEFGKQ